MLKSVANKHVNRNVANVLDTLSDQGWRLCEGVRLHVICRFFGDPWSLDGTCIVCFINSPVKHVCHELLGLESERHGVLPSNSIRQTNNVSACVVVDMTPNIMLDP